jgi:hypothetical protein
MRTIIYIILVSCFSIGYAQQEPKRSDCRPCREHPQVNGPQFTIRGIMRLWNGMPSVRISKVGTNRILGVSEGNYALEGYSNLPDWLLKKLDFDHEIVADFVLYPFTDDKPGVMRFVCVDTAYNLKTRVIE